MCLEKFDCENLEAEREIRFKSLKMMSSSTLQQLKNAYTNSTDDDEHEFSFSLRTRQSVAASISHILNCASVEWWVHDDEAIAHIENWYFLFDFPTSFSAQCVTAGQHTHIFSNVHTQKRRKGDSTHAGVLQNTLDWWCYKKKVYSRRLTLSLAACLPTLFAIVTDNSPVCWICYTTFFCAISVPRKKNDTTDNNTRANSRWKFRHVLQDLRRWLGKTWARQQQHESEFIIFSFSFLSLRPHTRRNSPLTLRQRWAQKKILCFSFSIHELTLMNGSRLLPFLLIRHHST